MVEFRFGCRLLGLLREYSAFARESELSVRFSVWRFGGEARLGAGFWVG